MCAGRNKEREAYLLGLKHGQLSIRPEIKHFEWMQQIHESMHGLEITAQNWRFFGYGVAVTIVGGVALVLVKLAQLG